MRQKITNSFKKITSLWILAAVLVTIGYSKAKRLIVDNSRHRAVLIYYGIALIFILSRIPWSVWP